MNTQLQGQIRTMRYTAQDDEYYYEDIKQFTDYFNDFYGINGVYPYRDTNMELITIAMELLFKNRPDYIFVGDSMDREAIRDIVFSELDQYCIYNTQARKRG